MEKQPNGLPKPILNDRGKKKSLELTRMKASVDNDSKVPWMTIGIFEEMFLPFFTLKITDKDEAIKVFTSWLTYAGGPTGHVELVDQTGKCVAIVPPIWGTVDLTADDPTETSLKYELEEVTKHAGRTPVLGQKYFDNNVPNVLEDMSFINHSEDWRLLLNFFNPEKRLTNETQDYFVYD